MFTRLARAQVALLGFALCPSACGDAGPDDAGGDEPDGGSLLCPDPDQPAPWPEARPLEVSPSDAWSATIAADSPFLAGYAYGDGRPPLRWAKWTMLLEDPDTVYFQDSRAYPFHHDFISAELDPLADISREELDAISLHTEGRRVALGAVLFPGDPRATEVGVQIVATEPLPPPLVVDLVGRVAAAIDAPGAEVVYVPAAGQEACAEAARDWLAERGVRVVPADAWMPGDQCYASGWAVGPVVQLAASEVEAAALDGRLTPGDVLLLEGAAPAELPPVAGILSLAPSTPSSHTAILAQSYGIPFAYLGASGSRVRAGELAGALAAVGAEGQGAWCSVGLYDLSGVPEAVVDELRAMAAPPPLDVPAKAHRGAYAVSVDELGPADIASVGGKAAHYGLLRDAIPDASRPAVALTMDLWDAFLDQELEPGLTLRADIDRRLGGFSWPPPMAELDAALAEVRDLIRERARVSPALRGEIEAALAGFDAEARLRFRSSTNVEDGATFTGAGLYDSISGCLADELDGDEVGPSRCNADKAEERGVYRALKKVYASFYRRNAFVERLRRGVDESEVGMAVLVHHSFPDETELANGVAVYRRGFSDSIGLVSQPGAVSVTNPSGGATPEEVRVEGYDGEYYASIASGSSLLPLGATVLEWDAEYLALAALLGRVADLVGPAGGDDFALDFEYKKIEPGELVVKQVRPLPLPDSTRDVTPLLVDGTVSLCVVQAELGDVFANHRQKSVWRLRSRTAWLTAAEIASTLLAHIELSFVDGAALASLRGAPDELPGFQHELGDGSIEDGLRAGSASPRRLTLVAQRPPLRRRDQLPVLLYDELSLMVRADTDEPVPYVEYTGELETRTSEIVGLGTMCPELHEPTSGDQRVERRLGAGEVVIETAFYWPPSPSGPNAGYTAPLVAWDRTTITGLTSEPIVLTSPWAQTSRPEHHNFGASYLFEPARDPGVGAATLAELEAADIQLIYANERGELLFFSADGTARQP